MKIITIGDLHGLDTWKRVNYDNFDLAVFLGDYVDSFTESSATILHNLKEIVELKKRLKSKVVLLWGNHDMQYLFINDQTKRCSGYRSETRFDLHEQFSKNKHLFQLAHQENNYLWTHAGVHKGWFSYRYVTNSLNLADSLNTSFKNHDLTLFDVGFLRGGRFNVGGPLWADARNMYKKPIPNYHQIVGHTRMKKINTVLKNETTSVTFCDVMEDNPDFYILEL